MALAEKDIDLIEKYIQQNLDEKESDLFRERMQDSEFRKEVEFHESIRKSSTALSRSSLKSTFKEWDRESNSSDRKFVRLPARLVVAASILLIGSITTVYLYRQTSSVDHLYETYYAPFPNFIDPIRKGEEEGGPTISELYESEDYNKAITHTPTDSLQQFYWALAHLETGDTDQAIQQLESFVEDDHYRFFEAAQWYLALAHLQVGQLAEAEELLQTISLSPGHNFSSMALALLQDL